MDNIEEEINEINIDIIFFFLIVVASLISFYIIIEKKKRIYGINTLSSEEINTLFKFNRRMIVIINIYFVINAYLAYQNMINNPETTEEEIQNQIYLMIATTLILIGALFYIPISNSNAIINK